MMTKWPTAGKLEWRNDENDKNDEIIIELIDWLIARSGVPYPGSNQDTGGRQVQYNRTDVFYLTSNNILYNGNALIK